MDKIILNPTAMLVSPLNDYWTKERAFTTETKKGFSVGIIERVGKDIPEEWVGKVIYYHTGLGTEVNIKGIGVYELIAEHTKLMVRLDQDKNNY